MTEIKSKTNPDLIVDIECIQNLKYMEKQKYMVNPKAGY